RGGAMGFGQEIAVGPHRLAADEPTAVGGTDAGPRTTSCLPAWARAPRFVALYARRKQWPLDAVTVRLRHTKIYAADCSECETREGMIDRIERDIELAGPLTEAQRSRLVEIA